MSGHNELIPEPLAKHPAVITNSQEESIAQSLIPWNYDDARARYIGLRCSGMTIREALKLIQYAHSSLSHWREDEEFLKVEASIPTIRKQLSLEYANIEFVRNYRLVLEKDYQVLKDSLSPQYVMSADGTKKIRMAMDKQDHEYLIKMRGHYTPQQLQIIETILSSDGKEDGFDFTQFILEATKEVSRIKIEAKKVSISALSNNVIREETDATQTNDSSSAISCQEEHSESPGIQNQDSPN